MFQNHVNVEFENYDQMKKTNFQDRVPSPVKIEIQFHSQDFSIPIQNSIFSTIYCAYKLYSFYQLDDKILFNKPNILKEKDRKK